MNAIAPRRLPVDLVVRRSFAFAWESRAALAGPFAIFVILTILADVALSEVDAKPSQLAVFLLNAAEEVFAMAFAVGVHRYVLLAEAPHGWRFFRWDRHFLQYVRATLVLVMLGVLAILPSYGVANGVAGQPGSGPAGALSLVALATTALGAVILARLAMMLPAAAVGDHRPVRSLWEATHGNSLRLLAVALLTAFPFLVGDVAIATLAGRWGPGMGLIRLIGLNVADELMSSAQVIVVTIMLSLCYDALVRGGGPGNPP